jgi:hypothetical protein
MIILCKRLKHTHFVWVYIGIMNPLKQIFKKHDVGLAITLAFLIFVFIYSGISWFIPLD